MFTQICSDVSRVVAYGQKDRRTDGRPAERESDLRHSQMLLIFSI